MCSAPGRLRCRRRYNRPLSSGGGGASEYNEDRIINRENEESNSSRGNSRGGRRSLSTQLALVGRCRVRPTCILDLPLFTLPPILTLISVSIGIRIVGLLVVSINMIIILNSIINSIVIDTSAHINQ